MRFVLPVFTISAFAWLVQGAQHTDGRCDAAVLRTAADVTRTAFVEGRKDAPFEFACTVLLDSPAGQPDVSVEDASGATILRKAGDLHRGYGVPLRLCGRNGGWRGGRGRDPCRNALGLQRTDRADHDAVFRTLVGIRSRCREDHLE